MASGPKNSWGGKRAGSGRKRQVSEAEFTRLLRAMRKEAKDRNTTWQEIFAKKCLGADKDQSAKFFKMFMDQLKVRVSEQNVNVNMNQGAGVQLPQMRPDPAKLKVV